MEITSTIQKWIVAVVVVTIDVIVITNAVIVIIVVDIDIWVVEVVVHLNLVKGIAHLRLALTTGCFHQARRWSGTIAIHW